MSYAYTLTRSNGPFLGLVALQSDQTIERDMRRLFPTETEFYVSRVPSGRDVTPDSVAEMEDHLSKAANLLPPQVAYRVVGYGCTSGAAHIGAEKIAAHISAGAETESVTDPLTALVAACRALSLTRLAILSPYVEEVSAKLRDRLKDVGITTPVFGSFDEANEARVVRIDNASLICAARDLMAGAAADALFLSCTNLRTLDVIASLEAELGVPVLSSNLVLAWHMSELAELQLAGSDFDAGNRPRLLRL